MDTHNFANALSNIFRNLVPAQNQQQEPNHEIRDEQRLGSGESSATPNTVSEPSQAIENGASASQPILDVEMDTVNSSEIIDDDDEMPALQSVSDSDSEDDDLDEVEMQTHDDDQANRNAFANGGAGDRLMPTSVPHQQESSANPASSASSTPSAHGRPNRRARVEDDDDEERDRRHPFERVGTPRNSAPTSTPAPNATPATPAPSGAAPPPQLQPQELRAALNDVMGLFLQELRQRMETRLDPGQQQQQQQQQQAQENPQTQNQQPPQPQNNNGNGFPTFQNLFEGGDAGGFAITFDITSNGPQPVTIAHHATRPGNGQGPPGSRSNPISMDSDALLNFFNILQFLPINTGPEIEDPERAKQLIDALEEVPEGLIRRMERVSEGVDLSGTGDVNCAICWDRLLDSEGGTGWEKKEEQKNDEHEHDHDHTHSDSEHPSSDVSTSSAPAPPSSDDHPASSSSTESSESKSNRIVSLPCAHVFHASCLIPWFSRPRQTTCPTCRFNIDPENLTYRPQARPARRNATGTQTNTTPVATQTPGEVQAQTQTQTQTLPTDTNPVVDQAIPAPAPPPANADTQGEAGMDEHSRGTADNLQDELNRLERLREVLQRRIDEAENEERELVEAIMNNGEVPMPMDMAAAAIANAALGQNARAPRNGPNTIPAPGANANANAGGNNDDDAPNGPQDGIHSVLTIGFDVIIGPAPSGNFPMGNTPGADQPQARDQVPGQGQGQGQNAPQGAQRFGAPFGAGMRTGAGGTNVQWATGSGRTINEAFASLFADGAIGGNRPVPIVVGGGNPPPAGNAPQPPPVVFGPPPPPQAGPRNGDGEGFTFGQIFSRMFGGQGRGQSQPQQQQAQPQTQPQAPPTQLPPFMGVNLGPLPASSNGQPAPVSTPNANANNRGPANEPNAQPRTNLPPLAQHFANMFGGIPGFPPGAVFVGGNAGGNATGIPTGATGPRTAPAPGGPPRPPPPPRERKKWALPAPPGPTLRQRIEKAEREAGLRCYDTSCGVGPSDEEPFTALTDAAKKQLSIQDADEKGDGAVVNVCPHTFHPSCLVSAARVALMGEDATVSKDGGRVEVACSVCRCDGSVLKHDWDEGVDALK